MIMIDELIVKNVATYDNSNHSITGLKELNFFYGTNGSGKTTIGRIIDNPQRYDDSSIRWQENKPLNCLVYNRDFINRNFQQNSCIPGVFTLGEERIENQQHIESLQQDLLSLKEIKSKILAGVAENEICQKQDQKIKNLKEVFAESFWKAREDLNNTPIDEYFQGYKGSKQKFFKKVLLESLNNKSQSKNKEELISEKEKYDYAKKHQLHVIDLPNFDNLEKIEEDTILDEVIIGKKNTIISGLIDKLNNSPWVNQGRSYLNQSDGKCPFCQQRLPEGFIEELENYFDTAYEDKLRALTNLLYNYKKYGHEIIEKIDSIAEEYPEQVIEKYGLQKKRTELYEVLQHNNQFLMAKLANPTLNNDIQFSQNIIHSINDLLADANKKIKAQNELLNLFDNEKLKAEVWKYIITFLSQEIGKYKEQLQLLEQENQTQSEKLKEINDKISHQEYLLAEEEKKRTSIRPTIEEINTLLKRYGFTNFRLNLTKDEQNYKIVRMDGSEVGETLSEGETSFITFLYFYFSLKGRNAESKFNIGDESIVVIDDPVSSLDSNILFMVATLIRSLFMKITSKDEKYHIKQLFVLTHNIYFFHEVTNIQGIKGLNKHISYYIVKKINGKSKIVFYKENPVKTTYQVLWAQVKMAESHLENGDVTEVDFIGIPNILRRIVEYYFKVLGTLNGQDIISGLPEKDKIYARSLMMYLNSYSHGYIDEAVNVSPDLNCIQHFLEVFKNIFYHTGNKAHYDMMMGHTDGD